jgi:hypothetical protein
VSPGLGALDPWTSWRLEPQIFKLDDRRTLYRPRIVRDELHDRSIVAPADMQCVDEHG